MWLQQRCMANAACAKLRPGLQVWHAPPLTHTHTHPRRPHLHAVGDVHVLGRHDLAHLPSDQQVRKGRQVRVLQRDPLAGDGGHVEQAQRVPAALRALQAAAHCLGPA
jgi:hypothetical protein